MSNPRPSSPSGQVRLLEENAKLHEESVKLRRDRARDQEALRLKDAELASREAEIVLLRAALDVERTDHQRTKMALATALSEMTVIVKHDSRRR